MPKISDALADIDVAVILLYLLVMLAIGVFVGRKHQDSDDYFLAGRKMTWPFIGLSLFASNISSTTLVGLAGDAYATGISVFNYEWMAAVVLVFFVVFFLPNILRSRVFTMPEFLERRYDGRARIYFSGLTIFLNIFVDTAGTLFGGALLIGMVFPEMPFFQIVALLALVAGAYTIIGGLAAVIYTDAIQAILLLGGSIVVTVIAFQEVGGWSAIQTGVNPEQLSLIRPIGDPGVPWLGLVVGVPLLGFYFWCTNQFMVQRVLSAKNLNHGRWGSLFAGFLKLPVLFVMVIPGSIAILLYPDLERPDLVYPTLLFDLLPAGLLGLALAAFIAALMSQIDSTLNSASTLITMDFVNRFRPNMTGRQLMRTGRLVTFIFMVIAVIWAPQIENFSSLFKYLQKVLAYTVPPIVCLFVVGTFWRRATAASAWATIVAGTSGGLVLFALVEVFQLFDLHFLYVAPLLLVLCLAVQISVVAAGTGQVTAEQQSFVWTRQYFDSETRDLKLLPWFKNYRILSVLLLLVAGLIVWMFA